MSDNKVGVMRPLTKLNGLLSAIFGFNIGHFRHVTFRPLKVPVGNPRKSISSPLTHLKNIMATIFKKVDV